MNVKEGTRQLALLFGVIGAIAGGVASYATLSDAMEARAHYKAFERLATSDAVEQERNYLLSLHLSAADVPDSTNFMTLDMSTYQPNGGGPPLALWRRQLRRRRIRRDRSLRCRRVQ